MRREKNERRKKVISSNVKTRTDVWNLAIPSFIQFNDPTARLGIACRPNGLHMTTDDRLGNCLTSDHRVSFNYVNLIQRVFFTAPQKNEIT